MEARGTGSARAGGKQNFVCPDFVKKGGRAMRHPHISYLKTTPTAARSTANLHHRCTSSRAIAPDAVFKPWAAQGAARARDLLTWATSGEITPGIVHVEIQFCCCLLLAARASADTPTLERPNQQARITSARRRGAERGGRGRAAPWAPCWRGCGRPVRPRKRFGAQPRLLRTSRRALDAHAWSRVACVV
jgi:hypothetical protein